MAPLGEKKWNWLALLLGFLITGGSAQYAFVDGDTSLLIDNADGILRCLHECRWACPEAGKFPAFQLILSVPLRCLGVSPYPLGLFLARLSILSYLGVLALTWRILNSRSRAVAMMAVIVLASGLPLHYANRSFGEMAAAFLTVAFAASWLQGRTTLVGTTAFVVALTKETAFPFLALLGLICTIVRSSEELTLSAMWLRERTRLGAMTVGISLAVLTSIGLNLFRFGEPYNLAYFGYGALRPDIKAHLNLFFALWLAPNAGLLFFWPLFVILFLTVPFTAKQSSTAPTRTTAPFVSLVMFLALLTLFYSGWWAPFGWWAWGQRLTLPWLPASILVLCFAYSDKIETVVVQLFHTTARAIWATVIVIVLALPHVASIFRSDEIIHGAFANRNCDELATPQTRDSYYHCIQGLAWSDASPLVHAYRLLGHPFVRLRALVYAGLLALAGRALYLAGRQASQDVGKVRL